jgi:hypothetical protein
MKKSWNICSEVHGRCGSNEQPSMEGEEERREWWTQNEFKIQG